MTVRIINSDVIDGLRQIDAESVHCVVTSPPYWGLRDYGVAGQIGMEPTMGEHIAVMVKVFQEVRRVLRKDGTLWLNYGDCYASDTKGSDGPSAKQLSNAGSRYAPRKIEHGLKTKDLCMIPNRLAIALQEDGWWVRSEIIWHKPNPMPESIKDRPGTSHEKVWLLSKSERYFYDHKAVEEPAVYVGVTGQDANGFKNPLRFNGKTATTDKQGEMGPRHRGFNARWDAAEERGDVRETRNLRNVWTIPTAAFSDAHFATFPPALVETCIKAGCPAGGLVLDPFGGSGTSGMVADRLGRNAILIELNPEYAAMAKRRIEEDGGMFASVA